MSNLELINAYKCVYPQTGLLTYSSRRFNQLLNAAQSHHVPHPFKTNKQTPVYSQRKNVQEKCKYKWAQFTYICTVYFRSICDTLAPSLSQHAREIPLCHLLCATYPSSERINSHVRAEMFFCMSQHAKPCILFPAAFANYHQMLPSGAQCWSDFQLRSRTRLSDLSANTFSNRWQLSANGKIFCLVQLFAFLPHNPLTCFFFCLIIVCCPSMMHWRPIHTDVGLDSR